MAATTDKDFLVKFQEKHFYLARTPGDKSLHGTLFMSYALRMSYRVAVEVAQSIRALGWGDALVTNLNGDPISLENIPVEQYSPDSYDEGELRASWDENVRSVDAQIPDGVEQG